MNSARRNLIAVMAAELCDLPACAGERDAVRALMAKDKFKLGDIAVLAEEALHEARRRASAAKEHH
ncbi:MAG: hypothetical protein ABFD89_18575 [Bryobacteraceae bacterium]